MLEFLNRFRKHLSDMDSEFTLNTEIIHSINFFFSDIEQLIFKYYPCPSRLPSPQWRAFDAQ